MPDPRKVLLTVRRAADLSRATPGRAGSVVTLGPEVEDVMVVGDLHGHVHNFAAALKMAALDENPGRHLVVQELVHDPRVDPDGPSGDLSHRLIDVVCALKCQHPERVHYLPGNHELSELTGRSIAKNGVPLNELFRRGLESSYGEHAEAIREAYDGLFRSLPLAIRTPNRVFICHTVPDERYLEGFDSGVLSADGWPPESMIRGGTVYAMTWGRDATIETAERFARIVDADLFVIGHHPCDDGFLRLNDRVLSLDATDPLPACVLLRARGPITIEDVMAGVTPVRA